METSQDLFKQLEEAEKLYLLMVQLKCSKEVRDVMSKTKSI